MTYNKYIFLVLLLLQITACSDNFLQTEPKNRLSNASFWNTDEDAELAVNALYDHLKTAIFRWDSISDIGKPNDPSNSASQNVQGLQSSTSGYGRGIWGNSYEAIRAVNDFLVNIEQIESDDPEFVNRLKAEARFIRAYQYSYLVMFYGDVPFITEPISINEAKNITRTDKETIWDFISTELQEISTDLPVSYNEDEGRITRGAALGWKARAMLWAGRYQEAATAARAVMDLDEYQLYPSYENLFSYEAEHNSGVILNKEYIRNENHNTLFFSLAPYSQKSSRSNYVPTKNLVDSYQMANGMAIDEPGSGYNPANPYENRDPRLRYTMFVYGDVLPGGQTYDPRPGLGGPDDITRSFQTTSTGFNLKKYVNDQDYEDPSNCGINIILQRYAEILLTYAEAKIELSEIDQSVYNAINEVRNGRDDVNMPDISTGQSQDELREIVRHERKVELAFEGLRYFDIRRWEIAPDVMNGPMRGITSVQNIFADRSGWTVTDFSSEDSPSGNVAVSAIDGDPETFWNTSWVNSKPDHPHYITIDMGQSIEIEGFRLIGREDQDRGDPIDITLEFSDDGTTWENQESFSFENKDYNKTRIIQLASARQARFLKLTADYSYQGTYFTHIAEIDAIVDQNQEIWVYPEFQRHFNAPRDYLLPIPDEELTLNPNLEQNPGY